MVKSAADCRDGGLQEVHGGRRGAAAAAAVAAGVAAEVKRPPLPPPPAAPAAAGGFVAPRWVVAPRRTAGGPTRGASGR